MRDGPAPTTDARAPRHVAIIMDGNGRWAARRGLGRLYGHQRGAETLRQVVEACPDLGVEILTLYAFSTENWRRPPEEVSGLMNLFRRYLRREAAELVEKGVRLRFIGDRKRLAPDLQAMMASVERQTAGGERLTVVMAINYGGRAEIAAAARALADEVAAGTRRAEDVTEEALAACLTTADLPDPDLVIRTSGEQRISNFLLWQCAYAEFVFAPELWPDFDRAAFERALGAFGARERRFGAVMA
jgi:undecaprenyl diphosphate synthase